MGVWLGEVYPFHESGADVEGSVAADVAGEDGHHDTFILSRSSVAATLRSHSPFDSA